MQQNGRAKWKILVPAALVILALISVWSFYRKTARNVRSSAYALLEESSNACAVSVRATLDGRFAMLETLAEFYADPMHADDDGEVMAFAHATLENGGFTLVGVADGGGTAKTTGGGELAITNRRYFMSAMRGERSAEFIETARDGGDWRIVLSVPASYAGRVRGVVIGSFTEHAITDLVELNSYEGQAYAYIVDDFGNCVVSADDAPLAAGENVFETLSEDASAGIANDIALRRSGTFSANYNGRQLVTYTPLGMLNWYLFVGVEENAAMASYSALTRLGADLSTQLVLIAGGVCLYIIFLRRAERLSQLKKLRDEADTDALTGLLNRAAFQQRVEEYLLRENGAQAAFLLIDIDHFKAVNDTYGHAAGDEALIAFSSALKKTLRETDLVGRFGGDEFAVLMYGPITKNTARGRAERLIAAFRNIKTGQVSSLPASIGVALTEKDLMRFDTVYHRADTALYRAKNSGRDTVCLYGEAPEEAEEQHSV